MIGPLIAGYAADITGGFDIPVLIAAISALTGGILIYIIKVGEKTCRYLTL